MAIEVQPIYGICLALQQLLKSVRNPFYDLFRNSFHCFPIL